MLTKVAIQLSLVTILSSAWLLGPAPACAQAPPPRPSVFQTTLEEPSQKTPEITTEQLQAILKAGPFQSLTSAPPRSMRSRTSQAVSIFTRRKWNTSWRSVHPTVTRQAVRSSCPGRQGTLLSPRMILYCNGPSCGKSKRTSDELLALGYTAADVSRYQLGLPVWRALSLTV